MIASTLTDIATLITALTALLAAIGALVSAVVSKRTKGKVETVKETTEAIHQEVKNGNA